MKLKLYQHGISIIETVIVIVVLVTILAMIVPSLVSFRKNQSIQNTTNAIVSLLEEARTKTLASYNNTFYSVHFDTTSATLFTGGSYSSSDTTNKILLYDSPVVLQGTAFAGGGVNIIFDRLKGTTSNYGTITIQIPSGTSRTITVSAGGVITRD